MGKSDITLPNSDIWPKVLEIADSYNYEITLSAILMLQSAIKKINKKEWVNALTNKNVTATEKLIDGITFEGKKFNSVSKKIALDICDLINGTYNFGVDVKKLTIDKYIDEHVAELVKQVSYKCQIDVRNVIRDGWNKEIPPEKLYRNIKAVVPLDKQRIQSYLKYEHKLIKDENLAARFPKTPEGAKAWQQEIARLMAKKHQQLLLDRGRTIGRTESINLANEGSRQMYERAAEQNPLLREGYELEWVVTPDDRLCDHCRVMNRERCPFNGTFKNGSRRPTLHPRCRCCIVCVPKR